MENGRRKTEDGRRKTVVYHLPSTIYHLTRIFHLIFVIHLTFFLIPAVVISAQEEPLTLSVRTLDGLIIFAGGDNEIRSLGQEIGERFRSPLTTIETITGLNSVGKLPNQMELYFSPEGERRKIEHKVQEMKLGDAVRQGVIPNITGRDLYEAFLMLRSEGIGMKIIAEPPDGNMNLKASVLIHSSMIGYNPSRIFIDGRDYSSGAVGYNLAVLSPDGKEVLAKAGFETYAAAEQGEAMERFLRAQPEGAILLGTVFMGPGVFLTTGAIDALRVYGLAADINTELAQSHAFIGKKGSPTGAVLEQTAPNLDSTVTLFAADLYINLSEIETVASHTGGMTVILSDTAPTDTVYIITKE
ncbi:MAG: interleukin-like EMT inducer domain-containing protein [bacterium]